MPRINQRLEEIRNLIIWDLFQQQESAEDIGKIFSMSTAQIYNIIKECKEKSTLI